MMVPCGEFGLVGLMLLPLIVYCDIEIPDQHMNHCMPGPEVIKLFSCSTQLSMKFRLLMKIKILKNKDSSRFQIL